MLVGNFFAAEGRGKGRIPVFGAGPRTGVMRWQVLAMGDSRIRVGGNLASDQL